MKFKINYHLRILLTYNFSKKYLMNMKLRCVDKYIPKQSPKLLSLKSKCKPQRIHGDFP